MVEFYTEAPEADQLDPAPAWERKRNGSTITVSVEGGLSAGRSAIEGACRDFFARKSAGMLNEIRGVICHYAFPCHGDPNAVTCGVTWLNPCFVEPS